MKNLTNYFKASVRNVRLSHTEKSAMRRELLRIMRPSGVPSPYWNPFVANPLFMRASAALLLVLMLGSGTAFASGNALPGDILYPVKTSVVEPAVGALKTAPSEKAAWSTRLAARRAEEAETLASRDSLSDEAVTALQARIIESKDAAKAATERLAEQDEDDAARLSTELDSSLGAHGGILLALAERAKNERTRAAAHRLSEYLESIRDARIAVATSLLETDASSTPPALAAKQANKGKNEERVSHFKNASTQTLSEARGKVRSFKKALTASTSDTLEKRLKKLQSEIDSANDDDSVTEALRKATELNTVLGASDRLERNDILESSLEKEDDHSGSGKDEEDNDGSNSGSGSSGSGH